MGQGYRVSSPGRLPCKLTRALHAGPPPAGARAWLGPGLGLGFEGEGEGQGEGKGEGQVRVRIGLVGSL